MRRLFTLVLAASIGLVGGGLSTAFAATQIAQEETLRIFLDVPQKYSVAVKPGTEAKILVRERPGRSFEGKVVRTSSSLDRASRTLLTEIHLPNRERTILPGKGLPLQSSDHIATPFSHAWFNPTPAAAAGCRPVATDPARRAAAAVPAADPAACAGA